MEIIFKSTPDNFRKEKSGRKRNTVRKVDFNDDRFTELISRSDDKEKGYHLRYGSIGIQDTETGEIFRRRLTDITYFEGYLILSW